MSNKPITPAQLKCIATICSKNNINAQAKEAMVIGFSGGRATSSKDLYQHEAEDMQKHLQSLYGFGENKSTVAMKGKLLSYCHEIGWTKINDKGKKVADMASLNDWATKYGYLHKAVDDHSYEELIKLVSQFELFYKSFLQSI